MYYVDLANPRGGILWMWTLSCGGVCLSLVGIFKNHNGYRCFHRSSVVVFPAWCVHVCTFWNLEIAIFIFIWLLLPPRPPHTSRECIPWARVSGRPLPVTLDYTTVWRVSLTQYWTTNVPRTILCTFCSGGFGPRNTAAPPLAPFRSLSKTKSKEHLVRSSVWVYLLFCGSALSVERAGSEQGYSSLHLSTAKPAPGDRCPLDFEVFVCASGTVVSCTRPHFRLCCPYRPCAGSAGRCVENYCECVWCSVVHKPTSTWLPPHSPVGFRVALLTGNVGPCQQFRIAPIPENSPCQRWHSWGCVIRTMHSNEILACRHVTLSHHDRGVFLSDV